MFSKKRKAPKPTPAEAAETLRRAIYDAVDAAERAHVGLPAMISILRNASENLKYREAVSAPSSYSFSVSPPPSAGPVEKLLDLLKAK